MGRRGWKIAVIAVLVVALLAGIFVPRLVGRAPGPEELPAADLMQGIQAQAVAPGEMEEVWRPAVFDFSLELFRGCAREGENTLISPLSVLYALGMTANGAAGETKEQMEAVFGISAEEMNRYLYLYRDSLPTGGKNALVPANSIWFADGEDFIVNRDFLQTNADWYRADAYQIAFDEGAVETINDWVRENTDGRIPEMLSDLPEETLMCLVNALTFDAEWSVKYTEDQVSEGRFTNADGTEETVSFMHSTENLYLEDENACGVVKYYADAEYAFVALLPRDGISPEEYAAGLNAAHFREMLDDMEEITVYTALPRFSCAFGIELKDVLKQLGMEAAFDVQKADFSGIGRSTVGPVSISTVYHRAVLTVDEEGTRGASSTVVGMSGAGMIEEYREVTFDRPFLYLVVDCGNWQPIFVGVLNQAEAE